MIAVTLSLGLTGCAATQAREDHGAASEQETPATDQAGQTEEASPEKAAGTGQAASDAAVPAVDLKSIPAFTDRPYVEINGNVPYFAAAELTTKEFETYSDLDARGRCGVAYANVSPATLPTAERGPIGEVRPSGWQTAKYDFVDGKYLYNRCHLIGFQLAGENANEKNLITGTRYLNVEGMLPFENMVADYVKETQHHVLYRVTPVFAGENLVASGVLMEAQSVEDQGAGVSFCVYVYNNQPGVTIDYATGANAPSGEQPAAETSGQAASAAQAPDQSTAQPQAPAQAARQATAQNYVLNENTHKFHKPDCASVKQMKPANRQEVTVSRDDLLSQGYEPCQNCNP